MPSKQGGITFFASPTTPSLPHRGLQWWHVCGPPYLERQCETSVAKEAKKRLLISIAKSGDDNPQFQASTGFVLRVEDTMKDVLPISDCERNATK